MVEKQVPRITSEYMLINEDRVFLSLFQIAARQYINNLSPQDNAQISTTEARGQSSVLHLKVSREVLGTIPRPEVGHEAELMKHELDAQIDALIQAPGFARKFTAGVGPNADSPDLE